MSLIAQQQALQQAICGEGAGGVQSHPGLEVYRHAYAARLVAALRDNYEVLHRAMGDEDFESLAMAYLAAHPSSRPSIRWFGHLLPEFMEGSWPDLPHPAFADLARMDRALRDAFDAADAPAADATLQLTPETVSQPHPSVHLVPLQWQIEPAWRALRQAITEDDDDPELPAPEAGEHLLLVWRQGLDVLWRSVADSEAPLLLALTEGANLTRLGEIAGSAEALVAALRQWVAEGLLLQP
jgi:hypothetical protein